MLLNVVYIYKLLLYIGFTLSLFAMLTVLGMVIVRFRKPFRKKL